MEARKMFCFMVCTLWIVGCLLFLFVFVFGLRVRVDAGCRGAGVYVCVCVWLGGLLSDVVIRTSSLPRMHRNAVATGSTTTGNTHR